METVHELDIEQTEVQELTYQASEVSNEEEAKMTLQE